MNLKFQFEFFNLNQKFEIDLIVDSSNGSFFASSQTVWCACINLSTSLLPCSRRFRFDGESVNWTFEFISQNFIHKTMSFKY